MVTPEMLEGIPLLWCLFTFTDQEETTVFEIPESREFPKRGLELLRKLVLFSKDKDNFPVPAEHMEMLGLVRLADFLGMDDFLEVAARWLDVSVNAILNHNSVRSVYQLIRGRFRASRHKKSQHIGHCCYCVSSIFSSAPAPCRPQETRDLPRCPCCNLEVHPECYPIAPQCSYCYEVFRVLPCVVCYQPVASGKNFSEEYKAALPHRTPCCRADCHPECKIFGIVHCPLCRNPLKDWKVDEQQQMPGDWQRMLFVRKVNNCRRYANHSYEVNPPIHIPSFRRPKNELF